MTVALALAGLVFLAVGQGLRFGGQIVARQGAIRAESRTLALDWPEARRALAGMDAGSRARPALFHAAPGRLAFTTGQPGSAEVLVDAVMFVDERHRLVLRWTPHRADSGSAGERVLAHGVAAVSFDYHRGGVGGAWGPDWTGPGLPGLIRLSVVWDDKTRRPWPPIIVGPAIVEPPE